MAVETEWEQIPFRLYTMGMSAPVSPESKVAQADPASVVVAAASAKGPARRRLMRQTELVDRVKAYDPDADEALLNKAYVYAMKAHGKQFRASGDPYFAHPLEVAAILTGPAVLRVCIETETEGILAQHLDVNRLLDSFVGDVIRLDEVKRIATALLSQ